MLAGGVDPLQVEGDRRLVEVGGGLQQDLRVADDGVELGA
jgi:hypothetical protein